MPDALTVASRVLAADDVEAFESDAASESNWASAESRFDLFVFLTAVLVLRGCERPGVLRSSSARSASRSAFLRCASALLAASASLYARQQPWTGIMRPEPRDGVGYLPLAGVLGTLLPLQALRCLPLRLGRRLLAGGCVPLSGHALCPLRVLSSHCLPHLSQWCLVSMLVVRGAVALWGCDVFAGR